MPTKKPTKPPSVNRVEKAAYKAAEAAAEQRVRLDRNEPDAVAAAGRKALFKRIDAEAKKAGKNVSHLKNVYRKT